MLEKDKRLTWDVIGLDSNDETDGPDTFVVGQRVCNTGDTDATSVEAELLWQTANASIDLAPGTPSTTSIGTLAPAACYDAYFNLQVARNDAARDTTRQYLIAFSADGLADVDAPIDAANYNEIFVEALISQNRNSIDSIVGPTTVYQGKTYNFTLNASTATQGYQQLQSFINFPNNIFRIVSVTSTYSQDNPGTVNDTVYSDACGWVHDPQDANYFTNGTNNACATSNKEGGDISLEYSIEIIGTGGATVTALIADFSGSSFHYNADYGVDILSITALPQPALSIDDVSILEGNSGTNFAVFTVTLDSARPDADVQFTYNTTDGTAVAGSDYTATTGTGTIAAGNLSTTISVPLSTELIYENDETFTVSLVNPLNATIGDGSGLGTILNDDSVPGVTVSNTSVTEGGNLVFTLSLSNPSSFVTAGTVQPTAGTAGAADFSTGSRAFTFPVGATTTTVSVPTTGDSTVEGNETMRLVVAAITSGTATGVNNSGTGTIIDDDTPPPPPNVTIGDASISEGGTLSLPVSLSANASENISFTVAVTGGSANGSDFSLVSGTVFISAGSNSGTITISTSDDSLFEGSETVIVGVGAVTQGTLGNTSDTGTGTILDNDGTPDLTGVDSSTAEGGNLNFTLSLSNPSASPITVNYTDTPGTAAASDYGPAAGSVIFAPGETSKVITIASVDDSIDETTELFTLGLTSSSGVNMVDTSLTGTITDNDGAPGVLIADATASEGDNLSFTITLSNPSAGDIQLQLGTTDGTATSADYDNSGTTVTFPAGAMSRTVTIASTEDTIDELDEAFTIGVTAVLQGTVGDTSDRGTGTITDNDGAPSLLIDDISITEGGNLSFPVSLSNPSAADVTVTFRPSNGTASASDYTTSDVQITIPAGSTTYIVTIPTTPDLIAESDETVILSVQSVDAGTLSDVSDTGSGTIVDDDGDPTVTIGDATALEGNNLVFAVSLSNPAATDITLQMGTANGTASNSDYDTAAFPITIPAGSTTVNAQVATVSDLIDESDETMTLFVASVSAGSVSNFSDTGTGTIQDDDGAPSLSIGGATVAEGGALNFPVTLSNPSAQDTTLVFQPTDLTASAGDYTGTSVQITIPAGSTSGTVAVPTTEDTIDEMQETIQLAVSSVVAGTVGDISDTAVGTITDNDGAPDISIGDASITEGGALQFPVTLSNPSNTDIVLTFQPGDGTATSGDYTATPVQVTIPAGTTLATANVPTTSDALDELDETVNLAIASVDSGTVGNFSDTAVGTILDDDGAPSLAIGDSTATEGDDLVFDITLSNAAATDITITLAPTGITASAGDYDDSSAQITIPAGTTAITATVPTLSDNVDEPDETLTLYVASVDAGNLTDWSDTGTGTIQDSNRSIVVDAQAICVQDAPYVEYEITTVGFSPGNGATIEWIGSDNSVVQTLNNQPLTRTRLLWPGAAVDTGGNGIGWPGWDFQDGQWIQVPSLVRPVARLNITVNLAETVTVNYPATTSACHTNPPPGLDPTRDGEDTDTGNTHAIPTLSEWMLVLLSLLTLGIVARHRHLLVRQ